MPWPIAAFPGVEVRVTAIRVIATTMTILMEDGMDPVIPSFTLA